MKKDLCKGIKYEQLIFDRLKETKSNLILTQVASAGYGKHGPDLSAMYNHQDFNIEVKKDVKAQMGGGSLTYDLETNTFSLADSLKPLSDKNKDLLLESASQKAEACSTYLRELSAIYPIEYHKLNKGFPLQCEYNARDKLKKLGFLKAINLNIPCDESFIVDIYNSKGVYYMQIGKAGLFYLGSNPLDLDIPPLEGSCQVEMRLGYAGGKITIEGHPETTGRKGDLRCQARLKCKVESPHTLEKEESLIKLFSK